VGAVALQGSAKAFVAYSCHRPNGDGQRQFETSIGALKFPELAVDPPMLLNRSVFENSNMDSAINAAATENNYVLLYGSSADGMVIVDRIGSTLEGQARGSSTGRPWSAPTRPAQPGA
jgi:hypothetical protein